MFVSPKLVPENTRLISAARPAVLDVVYRLFEAEDAVTVIDTDGESAMARYVVLLTNTTPPTRYEVLLDHVLWKINPSVTLSQSLVLVVGLAAVLKLLDT
jgi:hypothetical protein